MTDTPSDFEGSEDSSDSANLKVTPSIAPPFAKSFAQQTSVLFEGTASIAIFVH